MLWHTREDLRPLTKVNIPGHWILVIARRIILLLLRICSRLFFFFYYAQSTELSRSLCLVVCVVKSPIQRNIISVRHVSFRTIASGWIYLTAFLLTAMKRLTPRNVTWILPGGLVGFLLSCAPGTRHFPGLNLPSVLSLLPWKKKNKSKQLASLW